MKAISKLLPMLFVLLLVAGCAKKDQNVTLDQSEAAIDRGGNLTLNASTSGGSGSLTWKSSDPFVAEVSQNGTVTARHVGQAQVTASYGDAVAHCQVIVKPTTAVLYQEPLMLWEKTSFEIRSTETRTILSENETTLFYAPKEQEDGKVLYYLQDKKLWCSGVILNPSVTPENMDQFLEERYTHTSEAGRYDLWTNGDGSLTVATCSDMFGCYVVYILDASFDGVIENLPIWPLLFGSAEDNGQN